NFGTWIGTEFVNEPVADVSAASPPGAITDASEPAPVPDPDCEHALNSVARSAAASRTAKARSPTFRRQPRRAQRVDHRVVTLTKTPQACVNARVWSAIVMLLSNRSAGRPMLNTACRRSPLADRSQSGHCLPLVRRPQPVQAPWTGTCPVVMGPAVPTCPGLCPGFCRRSHAARESEV